MDHLPFEREPALINAAGYPYDITGHSFTFVGGAAVEFDPALTEGRRPVIGYGSNQSPARLRQKYGTDHAPIPVQRAWLNDHDVVFSAHFASYGSLPAALRHVPGTRVAVAVNWLDDIHLAVMHPTEQDNYNFVRLHGISLCLDDGRVVDEAYCYLSFRGHIALDGQPVALAEVEAEGRTLPQMRQLEALRLMRDRLAPDLSLDDFVRGHIEDAALRAERGRALEAAAFDVAHALHDVIAYPQKR